MRRSDVEEIVGLAEVDPRYYSFAGASRDDALCLLNEGPQWHVFVSERGQRRDERVFVDEDLACTYFLKRLFAMWRPR